MVRPSPPRFLNFGDRFELPVVVQNQTDAPLTVDVARARHATPSSPPAQGRRVTVPAERPRRGALPRRRRAAPAPRASRSAPSPGRCADAAEVALPVWTPATTEAFATYGEIDQGAIVQPVKAPPERAPAVRRARGHDLVDRAAGADRRGALPRRLSLRVRRAALVARAGGRRAARRADRLPGRGPARAGGDGRRGGARPRAAARAAERRRRLRLLAARRRVVAVRQHPRGARARAREGEGLRRARAPCSSGRART